MTETLVEYSLLAMFSLTGLWQLIGVIKATDFLIYKSEYCGKQKPQDEQINRKRIRRAL